MLPALALAAALAAPPEEAPKLEAPAETVRLIGKTGWRVSDPIGFELYRFDGPPEPRFFWRRVLRRTLEDGATEEVLEFVRLGLGELWEKDLLRPLLEVEEERKCVHRDGQHHGRPTHTFICSWEPGACRKGAACRHKTHIYRLVYSSEDTGFGEDRTRLNRVIDLVLDYGEAQRDYREGAPVLETDGSPNPGLSAFRLTQKSLEPAAGPADKKPVPLLR